MFIKLESSSSRFKRVLEMVLFIIDEDKTGWVEVEGSFSLDSYYDQDTNTLIAYPYKVHPSATFNFETMKWEVSYKELMFDLRSSRSKLLDESDKAIAKYTDQGVPVPPEWVAYRQALRDLPTQPGVPYEIVWPTKPTT